MDSSLIVAREAIVQAYERVGRHADALRQLEALARLEPDRPERLAAVGLALARVGRTDEAVVRLARGAVRFADHPVLLEALGRAWLDIGMAGGERVALLKAVEALRRSSERAPSATSLGLLGRAWLALGDRAQALRTLHTATSYLPIAPQTFDWLADAAESQGRVLLARDALLRAAALAGDRADDRTRLQRARRIGLLSLRAGDPSTAVTWLERTLVLQPQDVEARRRLDEARQRAARRPPARS
jgi:tetratricopeptide (TPR) repeat protein